MRAVQITRFGGPEVMDIVDLPDPTPGEGQQLFEVSSAGVNFADTHHTESYEAPQPRRPGDGPPHVPLIQAGDDDGVVPEQSG